MKYEIIITAGGTSEKIDNVRKITNSSSGKLGYMIANKLIELHEEKINKIYYICSKNSIKPSHEKIKIIEIFDTQDLEMTIRNLLNGNNTITFSILNNVCAFAICLAASVGSIAVTIATIGLLNININIIDPNTLKVKCIIAALLAFLLAPILEINEVTHVPIFSPYSIGKAAVIGINP